MKKHGSLYIPGQDQTEHQKVVGKLIDEVNHKRNKILDDFAKAYMASTNLKPEEIALVQQNTPTEIRFRFMHSPLVKGAELESKLLVVAKEYVQAKQQFKDSQKDIDGETEEYLNARALYEAAHGRLLFILNKIAKEEGNG